MLYFGDRGTITPNSWLQRMAADDVTRMLRPGTLVVGMIVASAVAITVRRARWW
jgi:hypothetical protein